MAASAVTMSSVCSGELSACELGALGDAASLNVEDTAVSNAATLKANGIKYATASTFSRDESAATLGGKGGATEKRRGSKFAGKEAERRYKLWLRAEIVGLCILILIVWGLLSIPIVFFYIPVELNDTTPTSTLPPGSGMQSCDMAHKYTSVCNRKMTGERVCAAPVMYTGTTCQEELQSIKNCLLSNDESSHPLVATESGLEDAESALAAVEQLASGACAVEVRPFLCLHFFGLCDPYSGLSYKPTASQCKNLRDDICRSEWNLAVAFGLELPDCDMEFSDEGLPCDTSNVLEDNATNTSSGFGSGSGDGMGSGDSPSITVLPPASQQPLNCTSITCREGFYCVEGANICNPSCHSFNQYSPSTNTAIDFMVLLAACIGVITGVGVLVVAALRWKKVFVFPSSLVVYQTITLLVLAFFVIVNYMDNSKLYCAHRDLFQSLLEATPFCIITGVVFYYCLLQLAVFWLCHEVSLFWKVAFPFHSRSFQMAHRVKYVHIACIVICVIVPTIAVIPTMAEFAHGKSTSDAVRGGLGFSVTRFPPLLCTGTSRDATFYPLILPILIILMVGMTILIIVFWIIHKQHGLFKARQSKNPYKIGTAERKILIVFVYYIILAVIALLAFTLTIRDGERFTSEIFSYFECERKGHDPDNPCDTSGYTRVLHVGLTSLSYILLGLFPMVNFIFVINVREFKHYLKTKMPFLFKRPKQKSSKFQVSDTPSSTSSTTGMLPSTPQTPRGNKTFNY